MHNCAIRIRDHYDAVDKVISCIKKLTLQNTDIRAMFDDIGIPPHPIITRWASWLTAAEYYARELPRVREIVDNIDGSGLLL